MCPPIDLIQEIVHKLRETTAPAIMLMPYFPRKPWHSAPLQLETRVEKLQRPVEEIWASHRHLNGKIGSFSSES